MGGGMGMGGAMGMGGPGGGNYEDEEDYEDSGDSGMGGAIMSGTQQSSGLTPLEKLQEDGSSVRDITKTEFVVQFAWVPIPLRERTDTPVVVEQAVEVVEEAESDSE